MAENWAKNKITVLKTLSSLLLLLNKSMFANKIACHNLARNTLTRKQKNILFVLVRFTLRNCLLRFCSYLLFAVKNACAYILKYTSKVLSKPRAPLEEYFATWCSFSGITSKNKSLREWRGKWSRKKFCQPILEPTDNLDLGSVLGG